MFYDSVHSAISESCLLTNSNSNFKKYSQIIVVLNFIFNQLQNIHGS
ncbi:unnamed protein product [Callosobruchus maculatus]|uniref:Uncharacterized protein n=1 Tax=Callosobruchus maculatus TaxID=64391 RepID=A0A653D0D1_CALMS|nr:unnamed protein product [Callosobruchus maculatus]